MRLTYWTVALFPLLTGPALGQDAPVEEPAQLEGAITEEAPVAMSDVVVEEQSSDEVRGDWIGGATITSPEDEVIGKVVDLIIDTADGAVTAAIVSVGGFLGIGAKQIAVDWNELEINYDGQEITLAITREEAENAPEYAFRDRQNLPPPPPVDATGGTAGGMGAPTTPAPPLE